MAQTKETQAFAQLKEHLHEVLQLDRSDLDFGIYRIMNQKRKEIMTFLDKELLPQVKEILEPLISGNVAEIEEKMKGIEDSARRYSADPNDDLEYQELVKQKNNNLNVDAIEKEIYSDLYNFFKRYYFEGDFMSLPRYKEGVYALPYEGEEVKLHWANHDQYYIKTSEDLKNYTFKVSGNKRVRFEVVAGGTETNNNKAVVAKERRFILHIDAPTEIKDDELIIRFEYRPDNIKRKQDDINKEAVEQLSNLMESATFDLTKRDPTENNPNRTLIEKHLTIYTAKHEFDYFIHKNLDKFLRRELDFYIKNEIMYLDDIENESAQKVESYLAKIKAMRKVAGKLIQFLSQLENFQKKLWLKKKFVLETHYCITLDHIIGSNLADELLPIISANEAQVQEWVKLFAIDDIKNDGFMNSSLAHSIPVSIEFLKANNKLLVDTKFFDAEFKYKLLGIFDDLDAQTDGLLINSENFQALNLLQERYQGEVKCIYIDPPYNTNSSSILYKNNYKDSSWLCLIHSRVSLSKKLFSNDGLSIVAIDDIELRYLNNLLDGIFNIKNYISIITTHCNPQGRVSSKVSKTSEFHILHAYNFDLLGKLSTKKFDSEINANNLKRTGTNSRREERPMRFFPVLYKDSSLSVIPKDEYSKIYINNTFQDSYLKELQNKYEQRGYEFILPVGRNGEKLVWQREYTRIEKEISTYTYNKGAIKTPPLIDEVPKTSWFHNLYANPEYGSELLKNMIGIKTENTAKSIHTVKNFIQMNTPNLILDYFAGSGTTGHAAIALNREDNGNRKYILVEMGEYFESVTKPRILKAVYSERWEGGKPSSANRNGIPSSANRNGISHVVKYMTLEQYEDTLDNLELNKSETQKDLLDRNLAMKEEYMLDYMLDVESRGSQSLLNIDGFANPFDYALRITRNNDTQRVHVDLVETFNYLLGMAVRTLKQDTKLGIVSIAGKNSFGEDSLILWRDLDKVDNDKLDKWFRKYYLSDDFDFDSVYINGDNNLENMKKDHQAWKVRMIEPEFKRLMFDVQDI